jgi:hypothetical protein
LVLFLFIFNLVFQISNSIFQIPIVKAVELNFDQQELHLPMAAEFSVKVLLNTNNENINALDVKLHYPDNILKVEDLINGNSIVNFWIEKPRVENGIIRFSGIIPGGYTGENGLLLIIKFRSIKEGEGEISFVGDSQILLNDGLGTKADLKSQNLKILISESPNSKFQIPNSKFSDIELPESFMPEITRDSNIFDGKWFLVFATQDKGSGIDHYEILETRSNIKAILINKKIFLNYFKKQWKFGESPYIINDQKLQSYIFVKAIDKAGNERIVKINPQNPLPWYKNLENWIIIIVLLLFVYVVWRVVKRQETRSKRQEIRGKRQVIRDKEQETRGKGQEARSKRQEARNKL